MSYQDSLSPWCVIQHLPHLQNVVIARFRKRNDAEAHTKVLQQMNPTMTYEIIFEPPIASEQDAY
jgi:hypothetical protein